ncbi:branched-chain amino acid ABC transporter permease [Janibacter sp. G349]|jgi:branched-chain amino acid transport system permease protein|uniref:branched-chain amino acid ABC transporter permease n=1 Tax=unclassified Janibacter TaxID=2649294 RepID=UPI0020CD4076|nr:branched-chain amino acid ABC transporter permease [Janibacter sp. CX7]UTT64771.1 branched-chain amino acid ABC transporter permease [Janibacter sp. CX7]
MTTLSRNPRLGGILAVVGSVLLLLSGLLSWSYEPILGDISVRFWPVTLQVYAMVIGAVALLLALVASGPLGRWAEHIDPARGLRTIGVTGVLFALASLIAVTLEAGGLINANEGVWIALVGAVLVTVGGYLRPETKVLDPSTIALPAWVEIITIALLLGVALFTAQYALKQEEPWVLVLLVGMLIGVTLTITRSNLAAWLGGVTTRHRRVFTLATFVVALAFPFTQGGSEANLTIAGNVLIFAATALGLNIVVGLAGLLDLGYIAFLGAGAYVGASMSMSAFATIGWKPPFLVVMVIGGVVSSILGLIIGSPTLRVSGDYLAIVTLAFGEIFRLAMFNLDGTSGPNITRGSNGINAIPDLNLFGFNFGETHTLLGIEIPRAGNYYFVLIALIVFVIVVFTHLNNSRIGRGWVAIREDERAAEAMGVNVFGLKLLAFAGGASLAGMAGTVKAHMDQAVSPDSYIFLESAFLLAAVVLGGMGTVGGVLIGAALLKFLPEKLRFLDDYRLLMFGLVLVVMMRVRPEGLVASKRRQLEFHDDDEDLAETVAIDELEAAK